MVMSAIAHVCDIDELDLKADLPDGFIALSGSSLGGEGIIDGKLSLGRQSVRFLLNEDMADSLRDALDIAIADMRASLDCFDEDEGAE